MLKLALRRRHIIRISRWRPRRASKFRDQDLLEWPSRFWSVGPSISETIFDAGLRRATVNQYVAVYNADVASYRQTVLAAFQQVEDNLAAERILSKQIQEQQLAVQSAEKYLELATAGMKRE